MSGGRRGRTRGRPGSSSVGRGNRFVLIRFGSRLGWVRTSMIAKEIYVLRVSFLLPNGPMGSIREKCTKDRSPFYFAGTHKLNGQLGGNQTVICLRLRPLLKYATDMEAAVEDLND